MSAARHGYGLPGVAVAAEERPSGVGLVLTLLGLVIALAVAAIWFVAVPAFAKTSSSKRTCEVVFLESGSPTCVAPEMLVARAKAQKPNPA